MQQVITETETESPKAKTYVFSQFSSQISTKKGPNSPMLFSLNLRNTFALIVIPLGAIFAIPWFPADRRTIWFGLFYSYLRGFSIVTGAYFPNKSL